jgi:deoxyribose-phosphate aldolase
LDINKIVALVTKEVQKKIDANEIPTTGGISASKLAKYIEHSMLNPDITREKVIEECKISKEYGFGNICVTPYFVKQAAEILKTCNVGISAPIGFPHGAASMAAKICEIKECVANGATELDVSLNLVAIKSGEFEEVARELKLMLDAAGYGIKFKAIYEQGKLTDEEKVKTLEIIRDSGTPYVKISNALTGKAACIEDVKFVRGIVGSGVKIKIDGGIKSSAKANEILGSGADRIGCSASVAIVTGQYKFSYKTMREKKNDNKKR